MISPSSAISRAAFAFRRQMVETISSGERLGSQLSSVSVTMMRKSVSPICRNNACRRGEADASTIRDIDQISFMRTTFVSAT